MKQEKLVDIVVLAKRLYNLLNELADVSAQLAEAIDRRDEVSMSMLVAMRYEPLQKLAIADEAIREHLEDLGGSEDAARVRALLSGDGSVALDELEKSLAQQSAANLRLQSRLIEQDKILNRKIAGDKSIYQ